MMPPFPLQGCTLPDSHAGLCNMSLGVRKRRRAPHACIHILTPVHTFCAHLQDQRLLSSTLTALEASREQRGAPLELVVEVSRLSRNSRGSRARHDSENI